MCPTDSRERPTSRVLGAAPLFLLPAVSRRLAIDRDSCRLWCCCFPPVPGEFPIVAQTSRAKSNCCESAQISGLVLSLTYDGNARLDRTSQSSKLSRNACVQKSRRDWRLI